jgi:hypothetical protein
MQIKNLNGWQRLWVLTSLIYLAFVIFIAVVDFPSSKKGIVWDDEIIKNLSAKTLEIIAKADKSSQKWNVDLNNGYKVNVPVNTTEADLEYIAKDYNESIRKITNSKRMPFIGTMMFVWLIPCLAVYVLGLSLYWVYRGFRKEN